MTEAGSLVKLEQVWLKTFAVAKGQATSKEMVWSLQMQFSNSICMPAKGLEMVGGVFQNALLKDFGLSQMRSRSACMSVRAQASLAWNVFNSTSLPVEFCTI
jgi:hypothetical protein